MIHELHTNNRHIMKDDHVSSKQTCHQIRRDELINDAFKNTKVYKIEILIDPVEMNYE